jgi:hypothetical protein
MDSRPKPVGLGIEVKSMRFFSEAITPAQENAVRGLGPFMTEAGFYLAGGTAVALRLGHRRSVDLDWFCNENIDDPLALAQTIASTGVPFETRSVSQGTLHGSVDSVLTSFFQFKYPLLEPLVPWKEMQCQLAGLDDLACMKLSAVAQRGAKKDFLDIYALVLKHRPLSELVQMYRTKFSVQDIGHVLYAIAYFDDAEREEMPEMLWDTDWAAVKATLREHLARNSGTDYELP